MAQRDLQTAGRRRRAPDPARVAARVAKHCACAPEMPEGVQPLNPGFFMLERMRAQSVAGKKSRSKGRAKVRGK